MRGLEVYEANGSVKFTTSDRLSRYLDRFDIGTTAGSRTVLGLNTGTGMAVVAPKNLGVDGFLIPAAPAVTFNAAAQSVSWAGSSHSPGWVVTIFVY